jgi:hypothetical protein
MGTPHPDIGPELRRLAQLILDRLDPAVRAAATMATEGLGGAGRCQQVWCPVCALAAVANGEQHPLLTVIADHSVALLAVIRGMVTDPGVSEPGVSEPGAPGPGATGPGATGPGATGPGAPGPGATGPGATGPGVSDGRYHGIPIVVEPVTVED